jgi:ATP-dependent Lhr-like helicase
VLKRLEWQGEIRRGYFVAGLSGVQFALPEALELLESTHRKPASENNPPIVLNAVDPALPFNIEIDTGLDDLRGTPLRLIRAPSNHLVLSGGRIVMVCENHFQRFFVLSTPAPQTWDALSEVLRDYLKLSHSPRRVNRIEIHQINRQRAVESPFADQLTETGFEKDGGILVLWPSSI